MISGSPAILESDCVIGENLCSFGICSIKTKLEKTNKNFRNGAELPGTMKEDALMCGIECKPFPLESWQKTDKMSVVFNEKTLNIESAVLDSSTFLCEHGEIISFAAFGQNNYWKNLFKTEKLRDHDICKFSAEDGDPLQLKINGNNIEIHTYIEFLNTSDTQKALIKGGIEQWNGTYKYVYGHKSKVKVVFYEDKGSWKSTQKSIVFECIKEEECLAVGNNLVIGVDITEGDTFKRSNTDHRNNAGSWDYGCIKITIYPITPRNMLDENDNVIEDADGNFMYEVRKVSDKEFKNVTAHEFGHALGIADTDRKQYPSNFMLHGGYGRDDIMVTINYEKDIVIHELNLNMALASAYYRLQQKLVDYSGNEAINEVLHKCWNKAPEAESTT